MRSPSEPAAPVAVSPREQAASPAKDATGDSVAPGSARRWPRVRGWMMSGTLVVVAAVTLPLAARHIVSSSDIGYDRHRLHGAVVLTDPTTFAYAGDLCVGTGRFAALGSGTTVTIRDAAGNHLAVASLRPGVVTADGTCEFRYGAVLPEVASYVFVVGDQPPSRPTTIWSMADEPASPGTPDEMPGDWWHTLTLR